MLEKVAAETTLTGSDLLKETQQTRALALPVGRHSRFPAAHRRAGDGRRGVPAGDQHVHEPGGKKRKVKVREPKLRFYHPKNNAFMPVEFSVGAYRFGHSMIRPIYRFNSVIGRVPIFSDDLSPGNTSNLNGFRPLPPEWGFEWQFFFELGGNPASMPMQKAYRIDQQLVNPLGHLPPAVAVESGRARAAQPAARPAPRSAIGTDDCQGDAHAPDSGCGPARGTARRRAEAA